MPTLGIAHGHCLDEWQFLGLRDVRKSAVLNIRHRAPGDQIMKTHRTFGWIAMIFLLVANGASWAATERAEKRRAARDVRQETRQDARETKQDCRAADLQSNPRCRQDKRQTKQEGRQKARDIKY
ncbi:hypothetical protein [Pseudomonas sp. GM84]|uniref:hypothetical protein n=1 Tax=Pseudomonas sp. GM84 TaxID=1144340 RepID=UPI001EE64E21|nr:hypothetical protein [Pseudomonas sp. GM84]